MIACGTNLFCHISFYYQKGILGKHKTLPWTIGMIGRRCSWLPLATNLGEPYFHHSFLISFLLISVTTFCHEMVSWIKKLIYRKLTGGPKIPGLYPLPYPFGQFGFLMNNRIKTYVVKVDWRVQEPRARPLSRQCHFGVPGCNVALVKGVALLVLSECPLRR